MKFTVTHAYNIFSSCTLTPIKRIILEYSALDANISGTVIKSQDEYDLMIGREFREAMNNFINEDQENQFDF